MYAVSDSCFYTHGNNIFKGFMLGASDVPGQICVKTSKVVIIHIHAHLIEFFFYKGEFQLQCTTTQL